MEISLKDQVVILDEAHNMEDTSRDSAGEKIGDDALEKAVNELDEMSQWFLFFQNHFITVNCCLLHYHYYPLTVKFFFVRSRPYVILT